MYRILFVCHGNICRSPMAEFIMKDLVRKAGLQDRISVDSAAVSYEEQGNGIYPPAKRTLAAHGVPFSEHRAHRTDNAEASAFDLIVIMDSSNRRLISRLLSPANMEKVHLMMEYADGVPARDVSDPWYSGDFETTYNDILAGCKGLLSQVRLILGE
ncbi:MAG: low molecular weight protein-tyrosine-phosphatase [Candidatus Cryptobacteroides sp.]